jgi:hypothetical protein
MAPGYCTLIWRGMEPWAAQSRPRINPRNELNLGEAFVPIFQTTNSHGAAAAQTTRHKSRLVLAGVFGHFCAPEKNGWI